MKTCTVRYPSPDANECGGYMRAHEGAYKCDKCGCVDAPLTEPLPTLAGGNVRLRLAVGFDRPTTNRLAFWWWRQLRGYGEYDLDDERY